MGSGLDTLNGSYLSIKAQGSMQVPEVVDDSRITAFSRHSKSDTHRNSQTHTHTYIACTIPAQFTPINPSTDKAKHMVQLLTKSLCAIDNC